MSKYIESFNTIERAILDFDDWDLMEPNEGQAVEDAYEDFAYQLAGHIHDRLTEYNQADINRRDLLEANLETAEKHRDYYTARVKDIEKELDELNGN